MHKIHSARGPARQPVGIVRSRWIGCLSKIP